MGEKSRRKRIKKEHTCPKCEKTYTPKYRTKNKAVASNEKTFVEQHMSGICGDECWNNSSEEELMRWKYLHPRYSHSCQKLICVASDTGRVFEFDNKNC